MLMVLGSKLTFDRQKTDMWAFYNRYLPNVSHMEQEAFKGILQNWDKNLSLTDSNIPIKLFVKFKCLN